MKISETGRLAARGFTLVELLVVLTLIVILAGVMVPRITSSLGARQLQESAASLVHTARTLRSLAMAQQRTYTLVIDGKHGGWMVRQEGSGKEEGTVQMSWLKGGRFPEGVRVMKFKKPEPADGKENEVRFKPDGTCSGAMIELGCGTRTTSMIIHPHNGRVVYGEDLRGTAGEDQYEMGE